MKIAITGKMCSGKSSIANVLLEKDSRFKIYSFGQKVKDVAKDLFDMKEKNRTLLTSIGTKMRDIDPDVWINYLIRQTKDHSHCIVDDLRYQNEYEALSKAGFKIIQLTIDPKTQEERIKKVYPKNYQDHLNNRDHLSERNEFQWFENDNPLMIDSGKETIEIIIEKINLYIDIK
tara:strand:+ start:111 stop:635 length:525 start_codon:yes stop_codon:yes gene_type:complete